MLQISKSVIECRSFHGDCLTLAKIIEARVKMFMYYNIKARSMGALLQGLPSTILYLGHFFLHFIYNIIRVKK